MYKCFQLHTRDSISGLHCNWRDTDLSSWARRNCPVLEWWDRWYFLRAFTSILSHTVPRVDKGSKSPRFATTCSVVDQWPPSTQADGSPCIVEPPKVNHTSLGQYNLGTRTLLQSGFCLQIIGPAPPPCKLSFYRRWHSRHLWIFLVILEVFLAPTSNKGGGCFLSL